jgi:hypothetical protein
MPRALKDVISDAEATSLADLIESDGFDPGPATDASPLRALAAARTSRDCSEKDLLDAVADARAAGISWRAIGPVLRMSAEGARKLYGPLV